MLSLFTPSSHFRPTLESFLNDPSFFPVNREWRPVVRRTPTEDEMKIMKLRRTRQRVAALQRAEQEADAEYERLERLQHELADRQEFLTTRKSEIEKERVELQKEVDAVHAELHAKQQAALEQAREQRRQELEEKRQLVERQRQQQEQADAAASVNIVLKENKEDEKSLQKDTDRSKELGRMEVDRADNLLTLTLSVPGLSKDSLQLQVKGGVFGKALHVSGQYRVETADSVRSSRFFRSVPVPVQTTPEDVSAELDEANGSLRVTVQLPSESRVAQKIKTESKGVHDATPAPTVSDKEEVVKEHQEHKESKDVSERSVSEAESGANEQTEQDVARSIVEKLDSKTREMVEQYVFVGGDEDENTRESPSETGDQSK